MLGHCLRCWPSIEPTLGRCLVLGRLVWSVCQQTPHFGTSVVLMLVHRLRGWPHINPASQQTQNIRITFVQRRSNVFHLGPPLYKRYTNILCLLGLGQHIIL